ncbi:MAG: hypothetical protein ABR926_27835 [Streptosporangiaceae bacterium]
MLGQIAALVGAAGDPGSGLGSPPGGAVALDERATRELIRWPARSGLMTPRPRRLRPAARPAPG